MRVCVNEPLCIPYMSAAMYVDVHWIMERGDKP